MLKTLPALAALAVASVLVVPTISQAADTNSVRVPYGDLNLANAMGQEKLRHRIAFAAAQLCAFDQHSRDLRINVAARDCRAQSIANAQPAFTAAINAVRHGTVTVVDAAALIVTAQ